MIDGLNLYISRLQLTCVNCNQYAINIIIDCVYTIVIGITAEAQWIAILVLLHDCAAFCTFCD